MVTPLEALKAKYMKDPDIIPEKGQDKEVIVEAMAEQQVRQKKNNERAFELLTKAGSKEVDSGASGGPKEGGESAMYRLTEFVQKPVEKTELDRKMWGEPTKKHLKMMNRPLEVLNKDDIDKISLNAPPAEGSDEEKVELEQLEELSGLLSDDQIKDRIDAQDEDLLEMFDRYLRDQDIDLDKEEVKKVMRDVNTILFRFKYYYNRPRPHQVSDKIKEIENTAGKSPSYPSGHSTAGAVIAELLARKYPEHAEALRVIGTEIGYNRVIAGLHYLSDHIAGLDLAGQVLSLLLDDEVKKGDAFMDELFKYMAHREELFKDMTQIGTQDILDGVRINKEKNPRIPRKKGQPAKSKKHSDLYTDEDPKGTITGLGFKDDTTARASVKKIRNSGRSHAHKIQAAVAMEQRAKAAGKSSEAAIYRKYIDSMKAKTKRLEKHTEDEHAQEHSASDEYYPKASVDKAKKSLLDQLGQIQNKIVTGDYQIEKFLIKAKKPDKEYTEYTKKLEQIIAGDEAIYGKNNAFKGLENASEEQLGDVVEALQRHDKKYGTLKVLQDEFGITSTIKDNQRVYKFSIKPSEIREQRRAEYAENGKPVVNPNMFNTILRGFAHNREEPKGNRSKEIEYHDVRKLNTETNEFESSNVGTFKDAVLDQTEFKFDDEKGTSIIPEGAEITANSQTPYSIRYTAKLPDNSMYQFEIPRQALEMAGTFDDKNGDNINTYALLQDFTSIGLLPNPSEDAPHTYDPTDGAFDSTEEQNQHKEALKSIQAEYDRIERAVKRAQEGFLDYAYDMAGLEKTARKNERQFKNLSADELQQAQDNFAELLESGDYGQSDILEHYFNSYLEADKQREYREAFEASKVGAAEANVVSEDFPVPEEVFRTYVDDMVQLIESENFVDDFLKAGGKKAIADAKDLQTEQLANLNYGSAFKDKGLSEMVKKPADALVEKVFNSEIIDGKSVNAFKENLEAILNEPNFDQIAQANTVTDLNKFVDEIIESGGKVSTAKLINLPEEMANKYINPDIYQKPEVDTFVTVSTDKGRKDQTQAAIEARREEEAKKIVSDDKSPVYNAADGSPINLKDSFYIKENMIDEGSPVSIRGRGVRENTENKLQDIFNNLVDPKIEKPNKTALNISNKLIEDLRITQESLQNQVDAGEIEGRDANKKIHDQIRDVLETKEVEDLLKELAPEGKERKEFDRTLARELGFDSFNDELQFARNNLNEALDDTAQSNIKQLRESDFYKDASIEEQEHFEKEIRLNIDQLRQFAVTAEGSFNTNPARNRKDTTGMSPYLRGDIEDKAFLDQELERLNKISEGGPDAVKKHLVDEAPAGSKSKDQPGTLTEKMRAKQLIERYGYSPDIAKDIVDNIYDLHEEQMNDAKGNDPTDNSFISQDDVDRLKYENLHQYIEHSSKTSDSYRDRAKISKAVRELGFDELNAKNYEGSTIDIPIRPGFKDRLNFAHTGADTREELNKAVASYIEDVKEIQSTIKAGRAIESLSQEQQDIYASAEEYANQAKHDVGDVLNWASKSSNAKNAQRVQIKGLTDNWHGNLFEYDTPTGDEVVLKKAGPVSSPFSKARTGELKYDPNHPAANEETQKIYDEYLKWKNARENKDKPETDNPTNQDIQSYHNENNSSSDNDVNVVAGGLVPVNPNIDAAKVVEAFGRDYFTQEAIDNFDKTVSEARAEEAPAEEPKAEEAPAEEPKAEEAPAEEPKAEEAPTGQVEIVDAFREGGKGTQHVTVKLEDGTLQPFAKNPATGNYQPYHGLVNTGKDQGLHVNSLYYFGVAKDSDLRGYGHQLFKDIGQQLDQGEYDNQIKDQENPLFRKASRDTMVQEEIKGINDRLKESGVELSPHLEASYENPIENPIDAYRNPGAASILGEIQNMAGGSELGVIKAYRDAFLHPEHGLINNESKEANLSEIYKLHDFEITEPTGVKTEDGKTIVAKEADNIVNAAFKDVDFDSYEQALKDAGYGKVTLTNGIEEYISPEAAKKQGFTEVDSDGNWIKPPSDKPPAPPSSENGEEEASRPESLPPSGFTDSGAETGFSSVDFLAGVPEELHGEINSVFNNPEMVDRLKTVYEDEIHPDDRNEIPFDEWAKENVVGDKGTTAAKIRAKFVPKARKITEAKAKEAPPPSGDSTGAAGGDGQTPPPEGKQFSEDDATRIAGELSDELTSMPELFTYKDGVNRKTAMANNRTMTQRARRLYRMIDLDSHPEIHAKLSPQAKQKLRNETKGIEIHLPKKIRDGLLEETEQYDKDSYYDHKDDTKQHNQDIEAKRQASAATEQSHKKTIQDMQKQGGKHELFNSDSHKKNMALQEWTGGEGGTRNMEAEFDQFMQKKYGADYSKEDAAKERREQGLPPGEPKPRMVKDKDGNPKFLGYYLWHAASRHWVTPEYVKLHPDLAGGARAGDVVTWDKNLKDSDGAIAYQPHDDAAREAGIAGVMTNNGMQLASRVGEKDQFDNTTFENISGLWDHMTPEEQKAAIQTASYVQDNLKRIRGGEGGITTGDLGQRISVYRGKGGALADYSSKLSAAGGFKGALARFIGTITPESLGGGPVREQYRGRGSREV